jgi:hypothetical protein
MVGRRLSAAQLTPKVDRTPQLAAQARALVELVQNQAPQAAAAIGVDLREVEAMTLRLEDIVAAGTGVQVNKGKFSGDIDIRGVRAGQQGGETSKKKA